MNTPAGGVTLPELPKADKQFSGITNTGYKLVDYYRAATVRAYGEACARAALAGEWRVPEGWRLVPSSLLKDCLMRLRLTDTGGQHTFVISQLESAIAAPLPKEPGR